MKKLFCEGCGLFVAEIKKGSKLRNGVVLLCERCETKRKCSDLAGKTNQSPFDALFKGCNGGM